jgi:hypothetical protein
MVAHSCCWNFCQPPTGSWALDLSSMLGVFLSATDWCCSAAKALPMAIAADLC